ncbi:hypothetical protein PMAYCL1PPCAC_07564, partial [Pristionchus mayeri]
CRRREAVDPVPRGSSVSHPFTSSRKGVRTKASGNRKHIHSCSPVETTDICCFSQAKSSIQRRFALPEHLEYKIYMLQPRPFAFPSPSRIFSCTACLTTLRYLLACHDSIENWKLVSFRSFLLSLFFFSSCHLILLYYPFGSPFQSRVFPTRHGRGSIFPSLSKSTEF